MRKVDFAGVVRLAQRKLLSANRRMSAQLPFLLEPGDFKMSWHELLRLRRAPRLQSMRSTILGHEVELPDALGYLMVYQELLLDQMYRFRARRPDPFIIDCGANVGLGIIYFKYLFPDARILAFEPDARIFGMLERNVRSCRLSQVTLQPRAVWTAETRLSFHSDGSLGGSLVADGTYADLASVETVRLRDFLQDRVDFLKIDIEGAESEVLDDCRDTLRNVDHLFVEYHSDPQRPQALGDMLLTIPRGRLPIPYRRRLSDPASLYR